MPFEVRIAKGWNKEGAGQNPATMFFILRGSRGAMIAQFETGIAPRGPYPSADSYGPICEDVNISFPRFSGIFAHSELDEHTMTETDCTINDSCEWLDGRACVNTGNWYTGTHVMKALANEGLPGVERVLIEYYVEHYGENP